MMPSTYNNLKMTRWMFKTMKNHLDSSSKGRSLGFELNHFLPQENLFPTAVKSVKPSQNMGWKYKLPPSGRWRWTSWDPDIESVTYKMLLWFDPRRFCGEKIISKPSETENFINFSGTDFCWLDSKISPSLLLVLHENRDLTNGHASKTRPRAKI